MPDEKLLSFKEVMTEVHLSANTIRTLRAKKQFPEPIKIGLRKIAWHKSVIDAWKRTGA